MTTYTTIGIDLGDGLSAVPISVDTLGKMIGSSLTVTASAVALSPIEGVDATNVQDAIEELSGSSLTVDNTLTGNGTATTPLKINLGNANTWTETQTFAGSGGALGLDYPVQVTLNASTALAITDKAYVRIPAKLDGAVLTNVGAMVKGASTSGDVVFTVKNGSTSMLTTNITIEAYEYDSITAPASAQPVIDTTADDVATADQIEVAVSSAGTGVTYAAVNLTFKK